MSCKSKILQKAIFSCIHFALDLEQHRILFEVVFLLCVCSSVVNVRMKTPLIQKLAIQILFRRTVLDVGAIIVCTSTYTPKSAEAWSSSSLMTWCIHYNFMLHHRKIDGANHDASDLDDINPSSVWILEFETTAT